MKSLLNRKFYLTIHLHCNYILLEEDNRAMQVFKIDMVSNSYKKFNHIMSISHDFSFTVYQYTYYLKPYLFHSLNLDYTKYLFRIQASKNTQEKMKK